MFPWTARFEALFASSLPSRRPSRPFNSVQRKEIRKQSQDERAISSKKVSKLLRQACLLSSLSLSPLSASRCLSRFFFSSCIRVGFSRALFFSAANASRAQFHEPREAWGPSWREEKAARPRELRPHNRDIGGGGGDTRPEAKRRAPD